MTPAGDFASIVRLEGVQKYFGAVHALRDIDLSIGRNEIVGLIGDNGAGKSTLIKVMTGVLEPTAGKIFIRDREIQPANTRSAWRTTSRSRRSTRTSRWPRNSRCGAISLSAGRSPTASASSTSSARRRSRRRSCSTSSASEASGSPSISTVANLSGGERQGIAIGRAMHYNADLIVLDEPTAALGVAEVRKVVDFVRRIKQSGRACIYIEHNLAHVHEVADRLVVLDRGRVVSEIISEGYDGAGTHRISDRAAAPGVRGRREWLSGQARRSCSASRPCRSSSFSSCCSCSSCIGRRRFSSRPTSTRPSFPPCRRSSFSRPASRS